MPDKLEVTRTIKTNNHDIAGLVRLLDRALVEVTLSQSSGITATLPFDSKRLKAYLAAFKAYRGFMTGKPFMDCPRTTPLYIEVQCFGKMMHMDNDSAWNIAQILDTAILELEAAQSGGVSNGFPIPDDGDRVDAYVGRIESLLAVFVEKAEPLDFPESSPRFDSTGQGATGISYDPSRGAVTR